MTIEVEDGEEGWVLTYNDQFIMASSCAHVVKKFAKTLSIARDAGHRKAMQIMIEELGMCESYAQNLYFKMHGGSDEMRAH